MTKENNSITFQELLTRYQKSLHSIIEEHRVVEDYNHIRGLPKYLLNQIHGLNPLSIFIPQEYGGRGDVTEQCLKFLEISSYESIAVGLMMGINGSLFIEPVSKYGTEPAKKHVFEQFIKQNAMGGLMITEPDFGTEALNMTSRYQFKDQQFHIQGTKHWGGLTGLADFWLITARQEKLEDKMGRDIDFFICEMKEPDQRIEVSEFFNKLGLFLIPYGKNTLNIKVPETHRLIPTQSGLKMMMDLLHRSRMRLSGIGIGFIKRMLDEAVKHTQQRKMGKSQLIDFDQVQFRLNELQAWFTTSSAMCSYAALNSGTEKDLFGEGLVANSMKSVLTDMMQDSAQSLMQLVGAKGFKRDHIAGRAIVDSRPFQIFEGSNDVMYFQVADMILGQMKKIKTFNLLKFISSHDRLRLTSEFFRQVLDFQVTRDIVQRKKVILGKIISRLITLNQVLEIGNRGFNSKMIENTVLIHQQLIASLCSDLGAAKSFSYIEEYHQNTNWMDCSGEK